MRRGTVDVPVDVGSGGEVLLDSLEVGHSKDWL